MGTLLSDFVPPRCPEGHYLRDEYGVIIPRSLLLPGIESCLCPAAVQAGPPYGHRAAICEACLREGLDGLILDPPCGKPGEPAGR